MNIVGEMSPRVGWCQRNKASKPTISFDFNILLRLVDEAQLLTGNGMAQIVLKVAAITDLGAHVASKKR